MKISKNDVESILDIYENDFSCKGNITKTTRTFCSQQGITYDDSQRRRVSSLLAKHFKKETKRVKDQVVNVNQEVDTSSTIEFSLTDNNIEKISQPMIKTPSLKDQVGMHIVLGCNHVPFHNKTLHAGILNLLRDYKEDIKGFHLIGDFLDLNTLSSHDKGRFTAIEGLTLDYEYQIGNEVLDELEAELPKDAWKSYLYGNHEDRYNRWMKNMDNAKTPLTSPKDALDLAGRGFQVKTSWQQDFFTLGSHLDIFHGIYFSIHSAKAHMDKLRGSCMYVHTHRIQQYIEGNTGSFNIGTCADTSSPAFNYASRAMKSQWANGFAVVMIDEDGSYNVTQVICQKGRFYFGGRKY